MTPIPLFATDPVPRSTRARLRSGIARVARIGRSRAAAARGAADGRRLAPAILASLAATDPSAGTWVVTATRGGDPTIVGVGPGPGRTAAYLRIARASTARAGLAAAADALTAIPGIAPPVATILPRLLGRGDAGGSAWLAESALPGVSAAGRLVDAGSRRAAAAAILAAVAPIHAAAVPTTVDEPLLEAWVRRRVTLVGALVDDGDPAVADALGRHSNDLADRLRGARLAAGWIHGDLWAANALVDPEAAGVRITGLVDWDSAAPREPVLHDCLHLALTTRRRAERRALGDLLVELLEGGDWAAEDRAVLGIDDAAADPTGPSAALGGLDRRTALRLYWLRFVEVNLARHPGLAADRDWVAANVTAVLACR